MIRSSLLLAAGLTLAGMAHAESFTLSSPDIKPKATIADEQVFNGFGCTGNNVSPALKWSGAPKGTKSFALLVHDPDAPTGGAGWWHWVAINLPADASELTRAQEKQMVPPCQKARCKSTPTSAVPAGAAPARLLATSRATTTSPCTR